MCVHVGVAYATAYMWRPEETQKVVLPFYNVDPGSPT